MADLFDKMVELFGSVLTGDPTDYVLAEFQMPKDPDPETRGAVMALNDAKQIPHDAMVLLCKRLGINAKFARDDGSGRIYMCDQSGAEFVAGDLDDGE